MTASRICVVCSRAYSSWATISSIRAAFERFTSAGRALRQGGCILLVAVGCAGGWWVSLVHAQQPPGIEARSSARPLGHPEGRNPEDVLAQLESGRMDRARFIAQGYFGRAWRRLARGELEAALDDFDRGLALQPTRRDAGLERARVLARLGRVGEALAQLDRLIDPRIDDAELLDFRIGLLSQLGDQRALRDTLVRRAGVEGVTVAEQIAFLDQAAQHSFTLGEHTRSLALLDALSALPGAPDVHQRRALAYEHLGDHSAALQAWQRVLEAEPEHPERLAILDTMIALARAARAVDTEADLLARALAWSGGAPDRLADLAAFEFRRDDHARAWALSLVLAEQTGESRHRRLALDRIIASRHRDSDALLGLDRLDRLAARHADHSLRLMIADLLAQWGQTLRAQATLAAVAERAPDAVRYQALMQSADLHGRQGEAIAQAQARLAAASLPGAPAWAWTERLAALLTVGRQTEAIELLDQRLRLDPDNPALIRRLIDLNAQEGLEEQVLDLYQRLAALPALGISEQVRAHLEAAEHARRLPGLSELAIVHYRRALDLIPEDQAVRLALAERLAGAGHDREAGEAFAELYRRSRDPMHALRALALVGPELALVEQLALDLAAWPATMRRRFWDLRGRQQLAAGEIGPAIVSWTTALALDPDPDPQRATELRRLRAFESRTRAEAAMREGRFEDAVIFWEAAESDEPGATVAAALGHAWLRLGEPARAARAFQRAVDAEPVPSAQLLTDLGYAHLRLGARIPARAAFVRAIDSMAQPGNTAAPQLELERLRAELGELDRSGLRVGFWQTVRWGGAVEGAALPTGRPAGPDVTAAPGAGGGLELAYQGHRPDGPGRKATEWFGRLLWSLEPDSHRIDSGSSRLGLGLRHRLDPPDGVWLSVERLWALGHAVDDEWLLRVAWSGFWGRPHAERSAWKGHVLADGGYLTEARQRLFYGEVRHGWVAPLKARLTLNPHFIVHGRGVRPDPAREGWLEFGVGLAVDQDAARGVDLGSALRSSVFVRRKFAIDGAGLTGWELGVSLQW